MRNMKLITLLGTGLALFAWARRYGEKTRQLANRRETVKEGIASWDNEGGNIPNVKTVSPKPIESAADGTVTVQNDSVQDAANSQPV